MKEIELQVESFEIKPVPRKLVVDWKLSVEHGIPVKNQDFKVGDTLEDIDGHTYGAVLSKNEKQGFAKHALLTKIDGVWRMTCCVYFDLDTALTSVGFYKPNVAK